MLGPLVGMADRGLLNGIHWLIAGAESSGAFAGRPYEDAWVENICDDCTKSNVAFFYKQGVRDGRIVSTPMLRGRQWIDFPRVSCMKHPHNEIVKGQKP
jgi:protein gp37